MKPYTYLVVIFREQIPAVWGFHDEQSAREFASTAGAQWSETYVVVVLSGPLV